jgi:hypothetical protein
MAMYKDSEYSSTKALRAYSQSVEAVTSIVSQLESDRAKCEALRDTITCLQHTLKFVARGDVDQYI